jgi:hypothetical protein
MRMKMWGTVCVLMLATAASFGQNEQNNKPSAQPTAQTEQSDGQHYHVVFVAWEVEGGKIINSRKYETDMALQGPGSGSGSIRTGARIPIVTGSYPAGQVSNIQTQFNYQNVGVDLDFNRARLEGDRVFLLITAEINSADAALDGVTHQPIIRQNKWSAGVTVQLGKPTVIFSSDDVSSKRTMQVELTVTTVR